MKAIFINEKEVKILGKFVEYEDRIYTNPEKGYPEIVNVLGYKELVEEEQPEYNPENQYIEPLYEEKNDKIIKKWEVKEIPEHLGGDENGTI